MTPRTKPAICMGPTGNIQGSLKFMHVESGKKLWEEAIQDYRCLNQSLKSWKLADRDKAESCINFKDWNKENCDWENEDDEFSVQEIAL